MLAKSRALIAAGAGAEIVSFEMFPGRRQVMCANSFVGFFGTLAESNASTVKFGASIDVPAAVIHGTNDEIALPPMSSAASSKLVYVGILPVQIRLVTVGSSQAVCS